MGSVGCDCGGDDDGDADEDADDDADDDAADDDDDFDDDSDDDDDIDDDNDDDDDDIDDDLDDDVDDDADDDISANNPPVMTTIGNRTVGEDQLLTIDIEASDPDGDDLLFAADNIPPGSVFDADNGVFTWRPLFTQAGVYADVRFSVSDGLVQIDERITITVSNVNQPPEIVPIGNQAVDEGDILVIVVQAFDGDGDALTYSADNLPTGAVFHAPSHVLIWRPGLSDAGVYPGVHFEVDDGTDQTESFITVTVNNVNHTPTFSGPLPDLVMDEDVPAVSVLDFDDYFADIDGTSLSFSFSGNAPLVMNVDIAHRLTITAPQDWNGNIENITVTAEDPEHESVQAELDVRVRSVNDPPVITSTPPTTGVLGVPYTYSIDATDPDGSAGLNYWIESGPCCGSIDDLTHVLTWNPGTDSWNQENRFTLRVIDGAGAFAQQTWTVDVDVPLITGVLRDVFTNDPVEGEEVVLIDGSGNHLSSDQTNFQGEYTLPFYATDLANAQVAFANRNIRYWAAQSSIPAPAVNDVEIDLDFWVVPITFQNQQVLSQGFLNPCDWNADGVNDTDDCPTFPMEYWIDPGFSDASAITAALDRLETLAGENLFDAVGAPPTGTGIVFERDGACDDFEYAGSGQACLKSTAPDADDVARLIGRILGYRQETDWVDLDDNNAWASGMISYEDADLARLLKSMAQLGLDERYPFLVPFIYVIREDDQVYTLEDVTDLSIVVTGHFPNYEINGKLTIEGTLVVLPGTHIRMNHVVEVLGAMVALGDPENPITIESITGQYSGSGKVSLAQNLATPSMFEYVEFKDATVGLNLYGDFDPFPLIDNCTFEGNRQALLVQGSTSDADALVTNTLFMANASAVWRSTAGVEFVNSVFDDNGEAFTMKSCPATEVRNSIFHMNDRTIYGEDCFTLTYSDVFDSIPAPCGTGCISVDPLFQLGSYKLQGASPLIDAGDPDPAYNDPDSSRNDMGIYGGPLARQP